MRFTAIVNYNTRIRVKRFLHLFCWGPALSFFTPIFSANVPVEPTHKCPLTDGYFRCIVAFVYDCGSTLSAPAYRWRFCFLGAPRPPSPGLCSCKKAVLSLLWPPRKSRGINTCRTRRNRRILNDLVEYLSSFDATLTKKRGPGVPPFVRAPLSDLRLSAVSFVVSRVQRHGSPVPITAGLCDAQERPQLLYCQSFTSQLSGYPGVGGTAPEHPSSHWHNAGRILEASYEPSTCPRNVISSGARNLLFS